MTDHCKQYTVLLSCCLDGNVTETEQETVEEHLKTCPGCARYFSELRQMKEAFDGDEDIDVPETLLSDILAKLEREPPVERVRVSPECSPWPPLVCASLFCMPLTAIPPGMPLRQRPWPPRRFQPLRDPPRRPKR
jgi:anti-sigma factor RsiW